MAQHGVQSPSVELSDYSETNSNSRKRSESVHGPELLDKDGHGRFQSPKRHRLDSTEDTRNGDGKPAAVMDSHANQSGDEESDENDGDFAGHSSEGSAASDSRDDDEELLNVDGSCAPSPLPDTAYNVIDDTYQRFSEAEKAIIRSEAHTLGING
ncbi:hypothetical protein FBU59_001422, partial [Linderina macrospora]